MKKCYLLAVVPAAIAFGVGVAVLALFLVKWVWAWTIPDLFPGAVKQGLIVGSISWFTAFKVAVFIGVLGGFSHAGGSYSSSGSGS